MKHWFCAVLACAAACGGKDLGKEIEKVNDHTMELAKQTDAVCYVADHLPDSKAEAAISEHAFRLLEKPQTDKVALKAQIDCIAKACTKSHTYAMGYTDNIIRAYAKDPSDAVKQSLALVSEDNQRKQLGEYLGELALREDDAREAAEVAPALVEVMDKLVSKTHVSAPLAVLYARTDHPALKARFDAAPVNEVAGAWGESLDLIERGPAADRKKLVEKLLADVAARKIDFDRAGPCRLAPDVAGCDAAQQAKAQADAKIAASTSPVVAILEPVQAAAAKAGPSNGYAALKAEKDGTAPSPVLAPVVEVPEMAVAVDKLVALGKPAQQDCRTMMRYGGVSALVCARALGKMKLELLTDATLAALTDYNTAFAKDGVKAHAEGHAVVAGLRALMSYKDKAADDVFLQSLSAYDPELAKDVMAKVKERAKMGQVIDGLFQFMARKNDFAKTEIDSYVDLLTSYGAAATAPIVKNLERELAKAKEPENVFWALKVVALFALEKIGTKAATPILDKYAADTSAYVSAMTRGSTGATVSSQDVPFADVVARTKKAVASR